ncbi:FxsA family protein [Paenibacillus montanisoli]|uniref:Exclusion suppressor FxsA n=1 Tax=Paenibacillus montanisoli TaxID=2081970 RepID=A0A328U3N2_9BACL|nr:FxsA family protein [Paenibacillus montanisoli]RAP75505.1 exclusion suppressor FxsA [Paenibacillus montanisoli]
MLKWLVAAIIIVPAVEMWGIIQMGQLIGGWLTFGLILLTGFAGAQLARREGRKAIMDVQTQIQNGRPPGHAMLNGVCVLIGGLLLLMPGFFTDIVGATLLLPITRPFYRMLMLRWLEQKLRNGSLTIRRR